MATGDLANITSRLKAVLPVRWFSAPSPLGVVTATPVLDAALAAPTSALAWLYAMVACLRLQTRLTTASEFSLDLIALDYYQLGLVRRAAETDASLRSRIQRALVRPRSSRSALISALTNLTGFAPVLFKAANPHDTGGYGAGPGTPFGTLSTSLVPCPVSTAVNSSSSGTTIYAPVAPLTGDTNIGY